tara:strand:+ start:12195 stop:12734 length:540 start_codon:yes stop_codon:yes gene_type:complete
MMWIFGYGSLIWRPDFPFTEKRVAVLHDWERRFYQASPDHRGTPAAPGRVVTLLQAPGEAVWGMAYKPQPEVLETILYDLDVREQAGYEHHRVVVDWMEDGEHVGTIEDVLVYVAGPNNPNFIGEAPYEDMAAHILRSRGPSGDNIEYLLKLAESLKEMGAFDEHVLTLAEIARKKILS